MVAKATAVSAFSQPPYEQIHDATIQDNLSRFAEIQTALCDRDRDLVLMTSLPIQRDN